MNVEHLLHQIPIFNGLAHDQLVEVLPLLTREQYPTQHMIIKEGSPGDSLFIVIRGSVRVTKKAEDGEDVFISNMVPGAYFGELALIDKQPRSANVITNEPSTLLRLRRDLFHNLLSLNKDFAVVFYRNCLLETIARIRETANNFTYAQGVLSKTTSRLNEIDADLSNAKEVQDYLINSNALKECKSMISGVLHSFIYLPYFDVGGDFVNIIKYDDQHMGIIISDVMGHGITAALSTGVLKSAFSIYAKKYGRKPAVLMEKLNEHFRELFTNRFATCYYALVDMEQQAVTLVKAGHAAPLVWRSEHQSFINVKGNGPGLGIMPNPVFEEERLKIRPGDKLLFYTDGIVEQRNNDGVMFGQERLKMSFYETVSQRKSAVLQEVFNEFKGFSKGVNFCDDITMLLLEF